MSVLSTTDPPHLPMNVGHTLGALLIGGLFAAAFWGFTSVQTYVYYQYYPKDRPILKLIVAILWILDTLDACLTSHVIYHYLVINYMNPSSITIPVWSMIIHILVTTITDVFIRCLITVRVWKLSNQNILLTSIVWIICLCDLTIGVAISVKAFHFVSWIQLGVLAPLLYASFIATFAGDVYVSVVLCYYLFKSRTGYWRTDTLINTLIIYIVTTGLLSSIDATLGIITYILMPTNYVFMPFYLNLAQLHVNSYLALLNARRRFTIDDGITSIQFSDFHCESRCVTDSLESPTEPSTPVIPSEMSHDDLEIAHVMRCKTRTSEAYPITP